MNNSKFIILDNGLTVLIYSDPKKMTNHVELKTYFGGYTEEYQDSEGKTKKVLPGTAHLLEHYVCEQNQCGNLLNNLWNKEATDANGITDPESTKYYFDTVKNFKECLSLLLNSIYHITFNTESLDKTKYAVYNEIRDEQNDERLKIYCAKMRSLFDIKRRTAGTKTAVKKASAKYLQEVYEYFYTPKNQLLVVAGSFDEKEILEYIKSIYQKISFKRDTERQYLPVDNHKIYIKESVITYGKLDEVVLSFKINTSHLSNYERYKLDWYLNYLLAVRFSFFSPLNEKLKKLDIITGNINPYVYNLKGNTIIEIVAMINKKSEYINLVKDALYNEENEKHLFDLAKKSSILSLSVRKDSIPQFVLPTIENYEMFDYPYEDTLEFAQSLNYQEYLQTIAKLDFSNYNIINIKGNKEKD